MPSDETLRQQDLDLKTEELAIRREEARAKILSERRNVWFASPLLLGLVGLLGTGIGAGFQGYWNARLERQKFEASLIEKALAGGDRNESAKALKFLVDTGLINGLDTEKITAAAKDPNRLPVTFASPTVMAARDAKSVLKHLGFYDGPIDDTADEALRKAVGAFQVSKSTIADGMIGPRTAALLKEAWPDYFKQQAAGP